MSATYRTAEHLGRRSAGRLSLSSLERFIAKNPPNTWEHLVDRCASTAYKRAVIQMQEQSDIDSAKQEMQRIINGYKAECMYFERDAKIIDEKIQIFSATLKSLKAAKPVLDAACFLRVRKHG
ncbi:hypothetical protein SDC9_212275 [bioreactor metagenome]|uniref:Uncharacterized protein n=1 Tax=bioreactor metagenome TaxID=1076179 RepID=A0A645JN35_9ZZZZ